MADGRSCEIGLIFRVNFAREYGNLKQFLIKTSLKESDWDTNQEFWSEFNGNVSQVKEQSEVKDDEFDKKFQSKENTLYRYIKLFMSKRKTFLNH